MPLISFLLAAGSLCRLSCHTTRCTAYPISLAYGATHRRSYQLRVCNKRLLYPRRNTNALNSPVPPLTLSATYPHHEARRASSSGHAPEEDFPESSMDAYTTGVLNKDQDSIITSSPTVTDGEFHGQRGSRRRKKQRPSRPASVLQSLQPEARDLYMISPHGKVDLSYRSPRQFMAGGLRRRRGSLSSLVSETSHHAQPTTLYSTLARYLEHSTGPLSKVATFEFSPDEINYLRLRSFRAADVQKWASFLIHQKSAVAVKMFGADAEMPPSFVLLLFLRRAHVSATALAAILTLVQERSKVDVLAWSHLKLFSVRLLRHARKVWPESLPWIASFYSTEATRLLERDNASSPRMRSDMTRFSNTFLHLLSLPTSSHPIVAASIQEQAQFQVLRFMAASTPAITVTSLGFRSVTRNQLAHSKTIAEKEWAELKGPSWPPWKDSRTAMDEDKSYEFGASRASKILHRMYEAGYSAGRWEDLAEMYAGWDTDLSPTIQTRTSLPQFPSQYRGLQLLSSLLWAGRVRTTRTRREAWACFLAYESSGATPSQKVYLAMFEKLHYPEAQRSTKHSAQSGLEGDWNANVDVDDGSENELMPGDMREVLPDSTSPLHHVYLSEAVPTWYELYTRMYTRRIHPSSRLLAFLMDTAPSFDIVLELLDTAGRNSKGGVGQLLTGEHDSNGLVDKIPGYLLAAFVRCLCRFGQVYHSPPEKPHFISPDRHAIRIRNSKQYLVEYAQALLLRYRPLNRPAWREYMEKLVRSTSKKASSKDEEAGISNRDIYHYGLVWRLVDSMEEIDLDLDDHMFSLVCVATTVAARTTNRRVASGQSATHAVLTGSPRLRKLFQSLTGAHMDLQFINAPASNQSMNSISPHIPGPAQLHSYVRALGILRDYEGLYSLSTWLTKHHAQVTARSKAQHGGSKLLQRTLVALRAALTGYLEEEPSPEHRAPDELVQLVRAQIEQVEEWTWPEHDWVALYIEGGLKSGPPLVGGR